MWGQFVIHLFSGGIITSSCELDGLTISAMAKAFSPVLQALLDLQTCHCCPDSGVMSTSKLMAEDGQCCAGGKVSKSNLLVVLLPPCCFFSQAGGKHLGLLCVQKGLLIPHLNDARLTKQPALSFYLPFNPKIKLLSSHCNASAACMEPQGYQVHRPYLALKSIGVVTDLRDAMHAHLLLSAVQQ